MRRACLVVVIVLGCGSDPAPTIGAPDGGDGGPRGNTDGGGTSGDGGGGVDGAAANCGAVGASCSDASPCCGALSCQSRGPNPKPIAPTCCVPVGGACNDQGDCCMTPEANFQITCAGDAGQLTCQAGL